MHEAAHAGSTVLLVDGEAAAGTPVAGVLVPWLGLVGLRSEFVDSAAAAADIVAARNHAEAAADDEAVADAMEAGTGAGAGPVVAVVLSATAELQRLQPRDSQPRPQPQPRIIAHITPHQAR